MDVHILARLLPRQRVEMVQRVRQGELSICAAAREYRVSRPTVYKWLERWQAGDHKLQDHSSRPHTCPTRLDSVSVALVWLMRQGRRVISVITAELGLARSTVGRYVRALGLGRLKRVDEPPRIVRYEMTRPGELVHLDVKKLRQFEQPGRKYLDRGGRRQRRAARVCLHVCVDAYSRYAYAELLPREDATACCGFLLRAVAHLRSLGVTVERILTDNAAAYRSAALRQLCGQLSIRQSHTRPYRPQTNGKAERFIRSATQEWSDLYYENSSQRDRALPGWLEYYNHRRPHHSLQLKAPVSRLSNCQQPLGT